MSSVGVSEECVTAFKQLKRGKHRYVIYKINDTRTEVVVDKIGPPSDTYSSFLSSLPENNCRYAVVNYEYQSAGQQENKLIFILWLPDRSPLREKMTVTSTKASFRQKLIGIQTEIAGTVTSELDEQAILQKVRRL
jgi:cofilin